MSADFKNISCYIFFDVQEAMLTGKARVYQGTTHCAIVVKIASRVYIRQWLTQM